jgi:hypothetical protein
MGDEQHAGFLAALHFPHQLEDLRLRGNVERGGRLVGDQQRGIEHQRRRDHDPLALAAGELVRIGIDHLFGIGQMHRAHDFEHACALLLLVEAGVNLQYFTDLVADPLDRVERGHRLLKYHGHAGAADRAQLGVGLGEKFIALQPDRAALNLHRALRQQAHHGLRRHRFAGAGFAHHADDLVGADGQVDTLHRMRPVASVDGDGKIRDFEDGVAHITPASPSWDRAYRANRRRER